MPARHAICNYIWKAIAPWTHIMLLTAHLLKTQSSGGTQRSQDRADRIALYTINTFDYLSLHAQPKCLLLLTPGQSTRKSQLRACAIECITTRNTPYRQMSYYISGQSCCSPRWHTYAYCCCCEHAACTIPMYHHASLCITEYAWWPLLNLVNGMK